MSVVRSLCLFLGRVTFFDRRADVRLRHAAVGGGHADSCGRAVHEIARRDHSIDRSLHFFVRRVIFFGQRAGVFRRPEPDVHGHADYFLSDADFVLTDASTKVTDECFRHAVACAD